MNRRGFLTRLVQVATAIAAAPLVQLLPKHPFADLYLREPIKHHTVAILPKEAWLKLDEAVLRATRPRLKMWANIIMNGSPWVYTGKGMKEELT